MIFKAISRKKPNNNNKYFFQEIENLGRNILLTYSLQQLYLHIDMNCCGKKIREIKIACEIEINKYEPAKQSMLPIKMNFFKQNVKKTHYSFDT